MSVTGKNIRKILTKTGHTDIFKVKVNELKKCHKFCAIDEENQWKVKVIKELVDVKQGSVHLEDDGGGGDFLSLEQIEEIVNYVSTC